MISTIKSFFKKKKAKLVVATFKVKVAGEEIVEVKLTGKTSIHVANLANRLKESLDIRFKNGQYTVMKEFEKVFEEADKVFKQADKA